MPGGYLIGEGGSPSNVNQGQGYPGGTTTRLNMSDVKMPMDAKDDLPKGTPYSDLSHEDVGQHTQFAGKVETAGDKMTYQDHQPMDHQEVNVHAQGATRSVTAGKTGQSSVASLDYQTVHLGNLGKGGRLTSRK